MDFEAGELDAEVREKIAQARALPEGDRDGALASFANIGAAFAAGVANTPDKNWFAYCDDSGRTMACTYAEFFDLARRTAAFMASRLELRAGDRVATLMDNDPRTVLIYFGTWLLGATVVPINCGEDDARVVFMLENSEAKAVFVHEEQAGRYAALTGKPSPLRALVFGGGDAPAGYAGFARMLQDCPPLAPLPDLKPATECLIIYTSGTTGAPKGVVLEQANLLADARSIAQWHRFGPDDRALCVLPIHHVNGIVVTLMTPLCSGGSVVLSRRFRPRAFWKTLAEERCTWVSVVPTALAFLCEDAADLDAFDLTRFRHIVCGAGPLTVEGARRFDQRFGVRVVHGYGLSETTCYSSFLPIDLDETAYRYWMMECGFPSIGCPISANEMAIHDAEGQALPEDARGEIVIRGVNVMKYYFKRPDANRDAFAHGWFRSGDEGFYRRGTDGRDYYFITGRLKELIIRGGVNYSPFDIDEALTAIPGVKAAMAVGFENAYYGEEVGAYVQLEAGASLTEAEIIRACRARLPFAKSPKVVIFGETFPVTSTGKYQRGKLKPLFAAWRDHQFRAEDPAKETTKNAHENK